jgi:glutamine synthetase
MDKSGTKKLTYGMYTKIPNNQFGKVIAEYIWIDGTGISVRSKSRTLNSKVEKLEDLPEWNFDGSSTGQAITEDSEVILKPVFYCLDPFRGGDNILVLAQCYKVNEQGQYIPVNTNFRHFATDIFEDVAAHKPWFGLEQEYTLFERMNATATQPLGWPLGGYPTAQGPYYCGVGTNICYGRIVMDLHYKACLAAKLEISGVNTENMPGQLEFQIGPCEGISAGDHMWIARYILGRITEDLGLGLSFDPKPVKGDWSGAGCHANFSTIEMREEGGYEHIMKAAETLGTKHIEHIELYGIGNEKRLHGAHETAHIDTFKIGVADRSASIRIPSQTKIDQKGYMEDRRPSSNVDPYIVSSILCSTILLEGKQVDQMTKHYRNWRKEILN